MPVLISVLCILAVLAGWVISVYNAMVQLRIRGDNAWSDIDVQLKRRYDLVPNIVAAVEGYSRHERTTLEAVIAARSSAMGVAGVADKGEKENILTSTLRSLFVVAEQYPELKASESFLRLQTNLIELEETIQSARRYYNAVVRDFNTLIQIFPASLIVGAFNFKLKEFFQLSAPEIERQAPQVKVNA